MGSERVEMSAEAFDAKMTAWINVGHAAAYEGESKRLRTEAGDAFARGNDDQAKWLRALAHRFDEDAKKFRVRQSEAEAEFKALTAPRGTEVDHG